MPPSNKTRVFDQLHSELRQILHEARWVLSTLTTGQKGSLKMAIVLMAIAALANAGGPLLIGRIVDAILGGRISSLPNAAPWLAGLATLYVFREVVTVRRRIVVERAATDVEKTALLRVVNTMFRADLTAIAEDRVGATHSRIRRSVDGVVRYVKLAFLDFVPALANACFAMAAALYQQPLVGVVMILIVPVGGFIVVRQLASQRGVRLRLLQTRETMDGTVVEQLTGMEAVRAANTAVRELARTADVAEDLRSDEMRHHKAMAFFDALKSLNEGFFHVTLLAIAIVLKVRGIISTGDVLSFSILFLATVTPLREIHRILDEAHESSLLVAKFRGILQQPVDVSFTTVEPTSSIATSGDIVIAADHVSAGYAEHGSMKTVLRDLSFDVRRGEIIGVAGPSGCGKSTALRLLLRLAHPTGGHLSIAGIPIKQVSREPVRIR
jgi:ATP-binding cassette subfamily B protein